MRGKSALLFVSLLCCVGGAKGTMIPSGQYPMAGEYIGVLPCADCAGVWTELTLIDLGPNAGQDSGTFVMTERFTGGSRGGQIIVTRGTWATISRTVARSTSQFSGTVGLHPEDGVIDVAPPRYFECDAGRTLQALDEAQQGFYNPVGTVLHRVIPDPKPRFLLDESANGQKVSARVGDAFTIRLPLTAVRDYRTTWTMVPAQQQSVLFYSLTGSGQDQTHTYTADFELHAVAAGEETVVFESSQGPKRRVSIRFIVAPGEKSHRDE